MAGRRRKQPLPRKPSGRKRSGGAARFLRETLILVVLVLALTAILRGLVFEPYRIPSGSMENTMRIGDRLLVSKLSYRFGSIHRGDVIVFDATGSFVPDTQPEGSGASRALGWIRSLFVGTRPGEDDWTKRVIGMPGDKVECRRVPGGHAMYVNGARLRETSYLYPGNQPCTKTFRGRHAITVPPGRLWVMGDHRELSYDSRGHLDNGYDGTIPESSVVGHGVAVIWPFAHWSTLDRPATFDQRALEGALPAPAHPGLPSAPPQASAALLAAALAVRRRRP